MGRTLCAWSPHWAIDNWRRRTPSASPDKPFALVETVRGVRRLAAVDAVAATLGLYAGQKAADAAALVPDLVTAEAEPQTDAAALEALVDWCVRFSPAVAADPPDGLFMDIEGVAHLWGGEAEMAADLARRLGEAGLGVRWAIADTPGAAWAVARFGRTGTIVPPGASSAALEPLPPAALRLQPDTAAQLARLGLARLSQLLALPRGPLARRFGREVLMRLDQALGRAGEALAFRRPPTPWFDRLAFAEPISAPEDLARVARDIAMRLCARLQAEGRGARRFELGFHRLDGKVQAVAVGLARPGREADRIARLFAPKLEHVDPGFGIEAATLTAAEVEILGERQTALDEAAEAAAEAGVVPLVDRLTNRLGAERVWRAVPVESHVPERAVGRAGPLAEPAQARPWAADLPRPLRLFRRPEPIEAMAPIPDDPPVQFRWRGRLHRVRAAEGPERIGEEWWRGPIEDVSVAHVRDYYRVEDQEGARFWVFRAGLYVAGTPAKWWLHGLFG
ncbi:MAG: DUF6504 family protein [Phenylobacterium sp.]|uniref:DUF6504 family protein n=1 Tax=Phenylobacterium sp. TaxID=1871053 RepID=UPI00391CD99F